MASRGSLEKGLPPIPSSGWRDGWELRINGVVNGDRRASSSVTQQETSSSPRKSSLGSTPFRGNLSSPISSLSPSSTRSGRHLYAQSNHSSTSTNTAPTIQAAGISGTSLHSIASGGSDAGTGRVKGPMNGLWGTVSSSSSVASREAIDEFGKTTTARTNPTASKSPGKRKSNPLLSGFGKGLGRMGSVMKRSPIERAPSGATSLGRKVTGKKGNDGSWRRMKVSRVGATVMEEEDEGEPRGEIGAVMEVEEGDEDIGRPFNTVHDLHVSPDLDDLPSAWMDQLKAQGMTESDLLLIAAARRRQRGVPMLKLSGIPSRSPKESTGDLPKLVPRLSHPFASTSPTVMSRPPDGPEKEPDEGYKTHKVYDSTSTELTDTGDTAEMHSPQTPPTPITPRSPIRPRIAQKGDEWESMTPKQAKRLSAQLRGFANLSLGQSDGDEDWARDLLVAMDQGSSDLSSKNHSTIFEDDIGPEVASDTKKQTSPYSEWKFKRTSRQPLASPVKRIPVPPMLDYSAPLSPKSPNAPLLPRQPGSPTTPRPKRIVPSVKSPSTARDLKERLEPSSPKSPRAPPSSTKWPASPPPPPRRKSSAISIEPSPPSARPVQEEVVAPRLSSESFGVHLSGPSIHTSPLLAHSASVSDPEELSPDAQLREREDWLDDFPQPPTSLGSHSDHPFLSSNPSFPWVPPPDKHMDALPIGIGPFARYTDSLRDRDAIRKSLPASASATSAYPSRSATPLERPPSPPLPERKHVESMRSIISLSAYLDPAAPSDPIPSHEANDGPAALDGRTSIAYSTMSGATSRDSAHSLRDLSAATVQMAYTAKLGPLRERDHESRRGSESEASCSEGEAMGALGKAAKQIAFRGAQC